MKESPIFVKTDRMIIWLLGCTDKFPKSQRFRLTKQIEDAAFRFQESIQTAATASRPASLIDADVQLMLLKRRLRMATEMHWMTIGQFEHIAKQTAELGRLLGAWRKRPGG